MKKTLLALLMLPLMQLQAQSVNIIPQPAKMEVGQGHFTIDANTKIIVSGAGMEKSARFLNDYLQKFYGFNLKVIKGKAASGRPSHYPG